MKTNKKLTENKEMSEQENLKLAYELKNIVSEWVEKFNFIQIDVLEKENSSISEHIKQEEITFNDVAEYSNLTAKQLKKKYGTVEECEEYEATREAKEERNYPMWNTCFEFKENVSETILQLAQDAGCGVIEGLGEFNQILFFTGCGYSFYGSHWIPLYLSLPYNESERKRFAGVKYDMM